MENNRNLILAFAISLIILLGFDHFYMKPKQAAEEARLAAQQQSRQQQTESQKQSAATNGDTGSSIPTIAGSSKESAAIPGEDSSATNTLNHDQVIAESPRIAINSPRLRGSIPLTGGRIDDLTLKDYHISVAKGSPEVMLASPAGTPKAYYAEFGWAPVPDSGVKVPTAKTEWTANHRELTPDQPVTMTWDNGEGLRFIRVYALDDNYMFTITQRVENYGDKTVELAPYGLILKGYKPKGRSFFILHEGPLGVFGEELEMTRYKDLEEDGATKGAGTGGWVGITDKYWLMALIPDQKVPFHGRFTAIPRNGHDRYQVDMIENTQTLAPGASIEASSRVFAGAKETRLLTSYEKQFGISRFVDAIDWGWFVWFTKPIFYSLHYLHNILGNFGLAIMALTVALKLLFFPLANKSYRAMSKMKLLQPKMKMLKEKYGDDRAKMQQETMALYREEKVNPLAGCLPIMLQIPVFFALYKVIFVTIEMRHAPFYGWIHDLSAPDTLTPFNLFGLLPFTPPSFLMIGVLPILMGITMFLQQKLNPAPADPIQAKVMMFLPVIFTFILAPFPAGLVVYWTWNNLLSILQQWVIMKRMGVSTK